MLHPTLWSVSRSVAILVAVIAILAAVVLTFALLALPATVTDRDTTLVLGSVNALPLAVIVVAGGTFSSAIATLFLRPWARPVLIAFLHAAGFGSTLVLVFIAVLLSQPGAFTAPFLTFLAASIAACLASSVAFFASAGLLRRAAALPFYAQPRPVSPSATSRPQP